MNLNDTNIAKASNCVVMLQQNRKNITTCSVARCWSKISIDIQQHPNVWLSLIAGLTYGMEWWNGKWNETVNVHNYS